MKYSSRKNISTLRITLYILFFIILCSNVIAQPTTEWIRTYPDSNTFRASAYALALDDLGNVYVTGHATNNSTWTSYCTIKYNSNGIQQWVANFTGPLSVTFSKSIALDKFSNVYVTGYSNNGSTHFDYCTVKYNSNGVEQWVRYYDGQVNGQDEAQKIVVDNAGNIYVSGFSRIIGNLVCVTIKYSPEGQTLWTKTFGNIGYVNGMVVDENCNIYITGYSNTLKYDSSGTLYMGAVLWISKIYCFR